MLITNTSAPSRGRCFASVASIVRVCRSYPGAASTVEVPAAQMRATEWSDRANDAGSGRCASYDAETVVRPPTLRADDVRTCSPGRLRGVAPFANVTVSGTRPACASAAASKTELSNRRRSESGSFGTTQVWLPVFMNSTGWP
jgi:hypothetical protein